MSLIAVARTSSPIGPSFSGTSTRSYSPCSSGTRSGPPGHVAEDGLALGQPDGDVDGRADDDPEGADDPGGIVGRERDDPEAEGERDAQERGERDLNPRRVTFQGARYGRARSGLGEAKPNHGHLRGSQRQQDPEAVEAPQEAHVPPRGIRNDQEPQRARPCSGSAGRGASAGSSGRRRAGACRAARAHRRGGRRPRSPW